MGFFSSELSLQTKIEDSAYSALSESDRCEKKKTGMKRLRSLTVECE